MSIIMNKFARTPSSACFSTDNLHKGRVDDRFELTRPHCDDDLSQSDDIHICVQAADGHLSTTETREQIDPKLRILMQQEQLDLIMSELTHVAAENEALKAERTVMVDKLALAIPSDHQPISRSASAMSFSKWGTSSNGNNGGSMQLLVDANANLTMENARLKVTVDIVRRSFQSYIKDYRADHKKEEQTIKALKFENKLLNQRLSNEKEKFEPSVCTTNTSLESLEEEALRDDSAFTPTPDKIQGNPLQSSIPDRKDDLGTSIETTIDNLIRGMAAPKSALTTTRPRLTHSKSANLLDGFEKRKKPTRSGRTGLSNSIAEGTARTKSDSLLVDFDQGRRAESRSNSSLTNPNSNEGQRVESMANSSWTKADFDEGRRAKTRANSSWTNANFDEGGRAKSRRNSSWTNADFDKGGRADSRANPSWTKADSDVGRRAKGGANSSWTTVEAESLAKRWSSLKL